MEAAIKLNKCETDGPCELTVRKRVTSALKGFYLSNGKKVSVPKTLTKGESIPQPNGKVGRPKFRFVPIVGVSKPVKLTKTPQTTNPKLIKVVTVASNTSVEPTTVPITNVTAPEVPVDTVVPAPLS